LSFVTLFFFTYTTYLLSNNLYIQLFLLNLLTFPQYIKQYIISTSYLINNTAITNFIWPYLHQFFNDSHGLKGYVMNIEWDYNYYQPWSDNKWLVDEMLAILDKDIIMQ